jgi:hypothetical protein
VIHERRHLETIVVAVVAAIVTAGAMSTVPRSAATASNAFRGESARGRVLAGFHAVRPGPRHEPVIDQWFNNVNGVRPTLTGEGGYYDVDVGFRTPQVFAQCSVDPNYVDTRDALCAVATRYPHAVRLTIWDTATQKIRPALNSPPGFRNAEFSVLVYGRDPRVT